MKIIGDINYGDVVYATTESSNYISIYKDISICDYNDYEYVSTFCDYVIENDRLDFAGNADTYMFLRTDILKTIRLATDEEKNVLYNKILECFQNDLEKCLCDKESAESWIYDVMLVTLRGELASVWEEERNDFQHVKNSILGFFRDNGYVVHNKLFINIIGENVDNVDNQGMNTGSIGRTFKVLYCYISNPTNLQWMNIRLENGMKANSKTFRNEIFENLEDFNDDIDVLAWSLIEE